jgi:hypothetical protein
VNDKLFIALAALVLLLAAASQSDAADNDKNIVFADFEGEDYGAWKAEGSAFGAGPAHGTLRGQMPVEGFLGKGLVNSFNGGDGPTGKLISPEIKIERAYISLPIIAAEVFMPLKPTATLPTAAASRSVGCKLRRQACRSISACRCRWSFR